MRLVAPWGAAIVLHPKGQGGNAADLRAAYDATTTPGLGGWRGQPSAGRWRIEVRDLAPADTGTLQSWWLQVTPAALPAGPVVLEESPGAAIPDAPAAGIERSLATAAPGTIGSAVGAVTVELDIAHSYIGDLRIALLSPAGTEVLLHDRGGAQADDIRSTYTAATTPALATLGGQPIAGTWRLRVADLERADTGKLKRWKLVLKP